MKRFAVGLFVALVAFAPVRAQNLPPGTKRIVFVGDSITYAGQYVVHFEAELLLSQPKGAARIEVLNLGLPSETVSGLSEAGHAGGKFPRPDVHERIARVLDKARPDLLVACYGMNCGIYLPLDDGRFAKYQQGLAKLREKAKTANAAIVHLTPPVFDPHPIRKRTAPADKVDSNHPYEKYDAVLDRYAEWLIARRADGWRVIDVHFPMKEALLAGRKNQPDFAFAGDGVHPNAVGQAVIGKAVLDGFGIVTDAAHGSLADKASKRARVHGLVAARSNVLRDAWLTHTGHLRPLAKGLPLDEATARAAGLTRQIEDLLGK